MSEGGAAPKPPNPGVDLLDRFGAEDIEFFKQFDDVADETLKQISRSLPAEFYGELRTGVLSSLMSVIGGGRLTVTLVVDTNIVVADAFRVAQGKPSTTERLMASRFVRLVAPSDITREAREKVTQKLPKGASLEVARSHVERLLQQIEIVAGITAEALRLAREKLADRDLGDSPFLAVLIDSVGEGIVSRDREAFESLEGVKRWELKEMADLVTVYESGTLALGVGAATTEALLELLSTVFTVVTKAILEAFKIFADIIVGFATGAAEALSRVPQWAWVVLGVVGSAIVIAAVLDEDFREWLFAGLSSVGEILYKSAKSIIGAAKTLVTAIHDFLVWVWELIRPFVIAAGKAALVGAGALYRRIVLLIEECNRAAANS
jgi:predicted nucleic acid-binding protein